MASAATLATPQASAFCSFSAAVRKCTKLMTVTMVAMSTMAVVTRTTIFNRSDTMRIRLFLDADFEPGSGLVRQPVRPRRSVNDLGSMFLTAAMISTVTVLSRRSISTSAANWAQNLLSVPPS